MDVTPFTLLDDGESHSLDATVVDDRLRLATKPTLEALGWTQKPEGLCQNDVCVPITNTPDLISERGIDILMLAETLGRPLAVNQNEAVACMGPATQSHGSALQSGIAPDFTLPDLQGRQHSLSGFRGKKVLLIAYASW